MHRQLINQQGRFVPKPQRGPLDELIMTVLSQHTSDVNTERAFGTLKSRFPEWDQVMDASTLEVADAIRSGGLADQKGKSVV